MRQLTPSQGGRAAFNCNVELITTLPYKKVRSIYGYLYTKITLYMKTPQPCTDMAHIFLIASYSLPKRAPYSYLTRSQLYEPKTPCTQKSASRRDICNADETTTTVRPYVVIRYPITVSCPSVGIPSHSLCVCGARLANNPLFECSRGERSPPK